MIDITTIDITTLQQAQAYIQAVFGYNIENLALVHEAIDATGLNTAYSNEVNRRLAIVGDKVLDLAIIENWYPTGASTGNCNNELSARLCNPKLAAVAERIGLARHLVLHPGHHGAASEKTLATGMEAVIGAIYLDCGKHISVVAAAMQAVGI